MNFDNHTYLRGYVKKINYRAKSDYSTIHFVLVVRRNYQSTVDGEKKYLYDTFLCKALNKRADKLHEHLIEDMFIEVNGTFESYRQSIVDNQLAPFDPEVPKSVTNQTLMIDSYRRLETKEDTLQRQAARDAQPEEEIVLATEAIPEASAGIPGQRTFDHLYTNEMSY